MGKARRLLARGVIGAAMGVVLAPRHGESRREALGRLRLAARSGRGARGAFAGTPCAAESRAYERGAAPTGGAASAERKGDGHG